VENTAILADALSLNHIFEVMKGAMLAKIDVKQNILVHLKNQTLLGMQFEKEIYIEAALPFRLLSAPKVFTPVADVLEWIIHKHGVE